MSVTNTSTRFASRHFEAMLNYYQRNYPRELYTEPPPQAPLPEGRESMAPVLMFHALKETASCQEH